MHGEHLLGCLITGQNIKTGDKYGVGK